MTYRDELDATLQRANALERELTAREHEVATLRTSQAQIDDLRHRLEQAKQRIKELQPPEPLSPSERCEPEARAHANSRRHARAGLIVGLGFALLVAGTIALVRCSKTERDGPPATGTWLRSPESGTFYVLLPRTAYDGSDDVWRLYPRYAAHVHVGPHFPRPYEREGELWQWEVEGPHGGHGANGSAPAAPLAIRAAEEALARLGWDVSGTVGTADALLIP